jgi:rhodanese-related sulfurtransferase
MPTETPSTTPIDPDLRLPAQQAAAWLAEHPDALVLDAREARHRDEGHWPGSVRLDGRNHEQLLLREPRTRPVLVCCYHGHASQTYAQMFRDFGFRTVRDVVGGWAAWQPFVRPPRPDRAPSPLLADWLRTQGLADAEAPAAHGNTPLMIAAWRGEAAIVEALLAHGVSLSTVNGDGNNALWLACVSNKAELVRRLAQAGMPVDHQNSTGATSLMYAASSGKPAIVQALLALGADPQLRTQDDFSALDMASTLDCLQLLRAATRSSSAATG